VLTWDKTDMSRDGAGLRRGQPRITVVTTRTALRAAGVPPYAAAILRHRLRLIPDLEDLP
jgi:hypothetical protein